MGFQSPVKFYVVLLKLFGGTEVESFRFRATWGNFVRLSKEIKKVSL